MNVLALALALVGLLGFYFTFTMYLDRRNGRVNDDNHVVNPVVGMLISVVLILVGLSQLFELFGSA